MMLRITMCLLEYLLTRLRYQILATLMWRSDLLQLPRKTPLKMRVRVIRSAGTLAVTAFVILLSAGLWLPAIGGWLDMPSTEYLHPVDAIIIHGGNPARTRY